MEHEPVNIIQYHIILIVADICVSKHGNRLSIEWIGYIKIVKVREREGIETKIKIEIKIEIKGVVIKEISNKE